MLYTIDDIVQNFIFLDDWEDKYRYLLDLGDSLKHMNEKDKNEQNKVDGCTSQVWLKTNIVSDTDGTKKFFFEADSDAHIVRGLIVILLAVYNGKTANQILKIDIENIFSRLGLQENLTPTRRNGFFSMVQRILNSVATQK